MKDTITVNGVEYEIRLPFPAITTNTECLWFEGAWYRIKPKTAERMLTREQVEDIVTETILFFDILPLELAAGEAKHAVDRYLESNP